MIVQRLIRLLISDLPIYQVSSDLPLGFRAIEILSIVVLYESDDAWSHGPMTNDE